MSDEWNINLRLEESLKLLHHSLGLGIIQIFTFTLPLPRDALALHPEIPQLKVLAELDHKVIHQIPVQLLKITNQTRLPNLNRVKETKIRLHLRPDNGPVNLPLKHLISKVEDVVHAIVGLKLLPLHGPQLLRQQPENLPEVVLREFTLYTVELLTKRYRIRCLQSVYLRGNRILIMRL